MFDLEDNLPDELMGGHSWSEQMCGNKPPAQGPGPGGPQMNGEDPNVANVTMQRQLQQQQQLILLQQQQQANKNQIIGGVNPLGLGQVGNKSPNLQSSPNVQSNMPNNIGNIVHSLSIANNGNASMNSMQGKFYC